MSQFQVDSAQVASAGTAVQSSAQQIRIEVDRLMPLLLDLQASWRGPASMSFQDLIVRWRTAHDQVRSVLEEIQLALAATSRHYEEAEASAQRMFASGL